MKAHRANGNRRGAKIPYEQMTDKQWETMLAIHQIAPFKLVRAAAPYFRVKDGEPRNIINISSTSGVHGNAYASSKIKDSLTELYIVAKQITAWQKLV